MAKISDRLGNMLTEYFLNEIAEEALKGITYSMCFKDETHKVNRYREIKKEIARCGYGTDDILRVFELKNGYITELDVDIVKKVNMAILRDVIKNDGLDIEPKELLGNRLETRRENDTAKLSKYIMQKHEENENSVTVALYSKNIIPKITVSGVNKDGDKVYVKYNAYALKISDMEYINANILIPKGLRIHRVEPLEIIHTGNGVLFNLYTEELK